ncbi:hypothetical protein KC19_3G120500 [Ceratodon purpureus]|uniref:Coiled-coil domain-containing protein R3HCC1L n=1 Tax=Ceratodon purpureus TaxID=3225 RepID=A0A8T0IHH7_CERPU|nr:hypothetical protein KC19_3G120500 [Ceratodon purpureus]
MAEEQGSEDTALKSVIVEPAAPAEVSLEGWSTRVEDLLDKDDEEGAVKLLEGVIAKLSLAKNATSNLGLAAAMSDLGRLYGSRGMSLKADQLLSDSLLLRTKAEGAPPVDDDLSWEDVADESTSSKVGVKQSKKAGSLQPTHYDRVHGAGSLSTAEVPDEDDWEAAVPSLLASPSVLPPIVHKTPEKVKEMETPKQKQRGRGAFTYGGGGNLYSDQTEEDRLANERLKETSTGAANDHWDGGAEHVLLIDGFSPLIQTKDLEDLLRPYSSKVSVRWIDDTSAAAVFRTPALARQALAGIRDPRFKVHKYTEAGAGLGNSVSLSVTDLEPPAPRPATTARVAQRMIAGALSRQGISSQNLRAKTKANAEQALAQEAERKQRLLNRQQLRDEAWGDD